MGASVSRNDFEWMKNEEPHAARRKEILGKGSSISIITNLNDFPIDLSILFTLYHLYS